MSAPGDSLLYYVARVDMIRIGSPSDDLRTRADRLLLSGEVTLAELRVQSPRPAICVVTPTRVIYVGSEQIGYRVGSIPYERVASIRLVRQRHISTVQVVHSTGKLMLTSADSGKVQRFADVLQKQHASLELPQLLRTERKLGAAVAV